jgi:cell division protein ZapA
MSQDNLTAPVEIFGKTFSVKCPPDKTHELQQCARYVDSKMRTARDQGKIGSIERVAMMAALTIAYELLTLQKQNDIHISAMSDRIQELQKKIETTLSQALESAV